MKRFAVNNVSTYADEIIALGEITSPEKNTILPVKNNSISNQSLNNQKSKLMGISFDNLSLSSALTKIHQALNCKGSTNLFFVNAHCLNVNYVDIQYRRALQEADLVFPDGSGVAMGCQLDKSPLLHNLNGTDLFPHICQLLQSNNKRVFLLGGENGTAQKVTQWMKQNYPTLQVVGSHHGHFDLDESEKICERINRSNADVLFVAMGVPRQELWLSKCKKNINTSLNIAVGGLFEFYSANIPRAPLVMRKMGIEWVWRLYQEPSRLWRRYILGSAKFIFYIWQENQVKNQLTKMRMTLDSNTSRKRMELRANLIKLSYRFSLHQETLIRRLFDISLATLAIIALLPFFPVLALLIKLDSAGPIFFQQPRVGYRGRSFNLLKLRSMHQDAEQRKSALLHLNEKQGGVMFKIANDPRITKIGAWLRKYSLDELPQLINVVKGDMSIVGPRPALLDEVRQYKLWQRSRLDVKPGLVSQWIVEGRDSLSFEQQAALDEEYYYQHSFFSDLKLIIKCIPIIFSGKGAS